MARNPNRLPNYGTAFSGDITPATNDGAALGTAALSWSDLFLASGGVINWANGNYTITHSTGILSFDFADDTVAGFRVLGGGGTNPGNLSSNVVAMFRGNEDTNSEAYITIVGKNNGSSGLGFGDDDSFLSGRIEYGHSTNILSFGNNANLVVRLNSNDWSPVTNDNVALGTTALMWSDLFLASGGIIDFNNGDVLITHSANLLTVSGGGLNLAGNDFGSVGNITFTDNRQITFGTTTGTKIGTATDQKLAFFNAAPIVQQTTTSQTPATFAANTSGTLNDSATWDGYTIGDVVAILRAFGFLA